MLGADARPQAGRQAYRQAGRQAGRQDDMPFNPWESLNKGDQKESHAQQDTRWRRKRTAGRTVPYGTNSAATSRPSVVVLLSVLLGCGALGESSVPNAASPSPSAAISRPPPSARLAGVVGPTAGEGFLDSSVSFLWSCPIKTSCHHWSKSTNASVKKLRADMRRGRGGECLATTVRLKWFDRHTTAAPA